MSASAPQPPTSDRRPPAATAFTQAGMLARWSARLIGLLLAVLVTGMRIYDRDGSGAWMDPLLVKVGLVVVFAGFVIGWWRDTLAGALILAGVALMIVGSWGMGWAFGGIFALFGAAGLLHLLASLGRRLESGRHGR